MSRPKSECIKKAKISRLLNLWYQWFHGFRRRSPCNFDLEWLWNCLENKDLFLLLVQHPLTQASRLIFDIPTWDFPEQKNWVYRKIALVGIIPDENLPLFTDKNRRTARRTWVWSTGWAAVRFFAYSSCQFFNLSRWRVKEFDYLIKSFLRKTWGLGSTPSSINLEVGGSDCSPNSFLVCFNSNYFCCVLLCQLLCL